MIQQTRVTGMKTKLSIAKRLGLLLIALSMTFVSTACQVEDLFEDLTGAFGAKNTELESTEATLPTEEQLNNDNPPDTNNNQSNNQNNGNNNNNNNGNNGNENAGNNQQPIVCNHHVEGEGAIVNQGEGYARVHQCSLCLEPVYEEISVVSVSNKWLYNENSHWNDIVCEETVEGSAENVAVNKHYTTNNASHDLDENGVCRGCQYNTRESQGLEFAEAGYAEGYVVVGRGQCMDQHINIPQQYNGLNVIGIADNAFAGNGVQNDSAEGGEAGEGKPSEPTAPAIIGITIPTTVITISCTAFSKCELLNNFLVDAANEVFKAQNNCLINVAEQSLVRGCEFSIIPDDGSVTVIGSYAFAGCEMLIQIDIPDVIESIEEKAVLECDALVEVRLPENVNLGLDVFRGSIHVEIRIEHNIVYVPAKEATCEQAGNIAHFVCADCGYYYEDQACANRLYTVEIPAAHEFENGVCTKCPTVMDSVKIVEVSAISYLGKFALGTLESAIGLPQKVKVWTADGTAHELTAHWDLSAYRKDVAGEYTITGYLEAGNLHFAEGVSANVEARIDIVEYMQGTADIVFVLDISGSMGSYINNVKNNIIAFAEAIDEQGVSARWGAITYSDLTCSGWNEQSLIIKDGAADWFVSADTYKTAIAGIQLAGGGDGPETAIDGLMLANTLSTRQDARVFYILLTDYSCKINNNYGMTSLQETAEHLNNDGINVSVITTSSWYSHYSCLPVSTGGITADINGSFQNDLLNALVPIIQNEVLQ